MLKFLLKSFLFLSSLLRKTSFELELFTYNFEFFSGSFTELLERSQYFFLLLFESRFGIVVIMVIMIIVLSFIDADIEKINFPKVRK